MDFLTKLANAEYSFKDIGAWLSDVYSQVTVEGGVVESFWNQGLTFIKDLLPLAWILPAILAVLSLVQVFAGKKLLGLQKVIACFVVGFACGAIFVTPIIDGLIEGLGFKIDAWIVGIVVGIVAALISKLVYFLAYVIVAGYGTYVLCMTDVLPAEITAYTKNMIVAIVAAVVVLVLALLLRKWIEMLGTACLGGWTLYLCFVSILSAFDLALGAGYEMWWEIGFIAVAGLIGFIVQAKTRRRY